MANWDHQQLEKGSGVPCATPGSAPGHWLREGRTEAEGVSAVPTARHLPSIPTDSSLDNQLFGMSKQNEVQGQNEG